MPRLNLVYRGLRLLSKAILDKDEYVGFPVKPEFNKHYNLGIHVNFNHNLNIALSGFVKKQNDLVRLERVSTAGYGTFQDDILYYGLQNNAEGIAKGFEINTKLTAAKRFTVWLNYTYSNAKAQHQILYLPICKK